MKRYERMSKEELMEVFKGIDCCKTCMFNDWSDKCTLERNECCAGVRDYLNEENKLKTVSRWQMVKSDEDLKKIGQDFHGVCNKRHCSYCDYGDAMTSMIDCFNNYLLEKIEVEDTE